MSLHSLFSLVVTKALTVAERVLDNFIDDLVPPRPSEVQGSNSMLVAKASIDEILQQTTERLSEIADASRDAVIGKIESDKLEELQSRIQNLAFLIRLGKVNEALTYVLSVKESVDYAENRLREGKSEWLGPTIIGKSTIVAALRHLEIDTATEAAALADLCKRARHELLDQVVGQLVATQQTIPWDKIQAFLNGTSDGTLLDEPAQSSVASDGLKHTSMHTGLPQDKSGELTIRMPNVDLDGIEITAVYINAGDETSIDVPIVAWESAKVAGIVEAPNNGVIKKVMVKIGDKVRTGDPIATLSIGKAKPASTASIVAPAAWPFPSLGKARS